MSEKSANREHAVDVVRRLQQRGFVAYWAGGCVRDLIRGRSPQDYDVATSARPDEVRQLFGVQRTLAVGESFGVVLVLGRKGVAPVEVATFRVDREYVDGRRPEAVEFSGPQEDAARRDFTINGMFYDPVAEQVQDFVGGRDDLERRIVRAIGDPAARMQEDKLRLLRAVRFAAVLDFQLDPATAEAVHRLAPEISIVSAERITQELRKMLVDAHRGRAVDLCGRLGLLAAILPELQVLPGPWVKSEVGTTSSPAAAAPVAGAIDGAGPGSPRAHPSETVDRRDDVLPPAMAPPGWPDTLEMLARLPACSLPLGFAVLLRNIPGASAQTAGARPGSRELLRGRAQARRTESPISPDAASSRAAMAVIAAIGHRLRLSNDDIDALLWLHAHQDALDQADASTPAPLKRLMQHRRFGDLLELSRMRARVLGTPAAGPAHAAELYARWTAADWDPPPLVTGKDVLEAGVPAGPRVKDLLEVVRDAQLDGELLTREAALERLRALVAE